MGNWLCATIMATVGIYKQWLIVLTRICCADPDTAHRVASGWPTLEDELKIARVRDRPRLIALRTDLQCFYFP